MSILHSWKDCGEVNSLDVNNRSCCVLWDVCECRQACSCTNICVEQLVLPLFCMNASQSTITSVENCSCLTFVLVGTLLSLSGRITHNMLCCGVTRTKFMDSLYSCFVAHLSLTHCYGMCSKWMHYRWPSISLFFKKRLILVRWLLLSLLNGCHVCFPWSFLKVKPVRTSHCRIKH